MQQSGGGGEARHALSADSAGEYHAFDAWSPPHGPVKLDPHDVEPIEQLVDGLKLDAAERELILGPDDTSTHQRAREFPLFQVLRPKKDFSDLEHALLCQSISNCIPSARRFPLHALITVSMNDYLARMHGRGKLRHSLGMQHDESVVVYADAAWTEEQARGYLKMDPLQRARCCAAWSMTLWTDGPLRVTHLLCAQPSPAPRSASTPQQFTITYQMVDKRADTGVLIFIESCCSLVLAPLSEILRSDPVTRKLDLSRGPWMGDDNVLAVSDAQTKYPNFHLRFSWYWLAASKSCQEWAQKWQLKADEGAPLQAKLHRELAARIERDFEAPEAINPTWSAMYNRLMFVGPRDLK